MIILKRCPKCKQYFTEENIDEYYIEVGEGYNKINRRIKISCSKCNQKLWFYPRTADITERE